MAHNRAERRRKSALIKHKLERIVQEELANDAQGIWLSEGQYRPFLGGHGLSEDAMRRRRFKNEGRHGRVCWECGPHACNWCLRGFYRKHFRRAQALENDLRVYVTGSYDALKAEGADIPKALLTCLPRLMGKCETK
jgi:hypothetical protein